MCGYEAIRDLEHKESMSYDDSKANIEVINITWSELENETREIIEKIIKYFSPFLENEPKEGDFDKIKEQALQLQEKLTSLLTR